jgi:hypothetical protein
VQKYTDIDYDSFPIPDLTLDKHWILLPAAVWRERCQARDAALAAQRLADLPPDHQIILVPADPTYSPAQVELWPIVNCAVIETLKRHESVHHEVLVAVQQAVDEYRGWRNPYPESPEHPSKPITRKSSRPRPN